MFGQCLVTPTLLDSFEFAASCPPSWKHSAMKDFIAKIKREKVAYPEWVNAGMKFEDTVYRVCKQAHSKMALYMQGSELFKQVTSQCYGGTFQNKLKKSLTIGEHKCFFFGYTDVDFPDMTIDIKTCLQWKGSQKYLGKNQHVMYLWMNGKSTFRYIVVEWADEKCETIHSVNNITYNNPGNDLMEEKLVNNTKRMFKFINDQGLWNDYYFTFSKN